MLRERPSAEHKKGNLLLGKPVCQQGFRRLMFIGGQRYTRLRKAASDGLLYPPLDGRRVFKRRLVSGQQAQRVAKRSRICEFLQELRATISEPMPEANQKTRQPSGEGAKQIGGMRFRRHRGKRPREAARHHRNSDPSQVRLLPPGRFTDYLALLQARHDDMKFSLKLFNKAPWQRSK